MAGDPVPYTIADDNLITSLLLGCFILAMISFAKSRRFITRQAKNFFMNRAPIVVPSPKRQENWCFQLFLLLQTCLLSSILYFFYTRATTGDTFNVEYYQIIGIYTGIVAAYFLFKIILYWFSCWVFLIRTISTDGSRHISS